MSDTALIKEVTIISFLSILSLFLMVKSDKQLVHLLEGKLFAQKRAVESARLVYKQHTSRLAVIAFATGFVAIGLAVIVLEKESELFVIPMLIGIACVSFAIWSRIRSFLAANRELEAKK